ncbi:MAG: LysM peptidoglycan-binding domain-containing protein [Firmicutes bacterium]|nr:LysM peptidoglycan-binding domain-containing protein [Bacillota bacterium]
MEYNGIDVSSLQGFIDWNKLNPSDINFAMIRATYGTSGLDVRFEENIRNIIDSKIHAGVYHEVHANNFDDAYKEARYFISKIKKFSVGYPAAFHIQKNIDKNKTIEIIKIFADTLKKSNYYPLLLISEDLLQNFSDTKKINEIDIWLIGDSLNFKKNVGMLRHSNLGSIRYIGDNVNLNVAYKNYAEIIKEFLRNNNKDEKSDMLNQKNMALKTIDKLKESKIDNKTENLSTSPIIPSNFNSEFTNFETIEHKVLDGETIWELARIYLGSWSKYREIMDINSLSDEIIHFGQILKIPLVYKTDIYKVRDNDNLCSIAAKLLGNENRYYEIMKFNGLETSMIVPGQNLKIPVT